MVDKNKLFCLFFLSLVFQIRDFFLLCLVCGKATLMKPWACSDQYIYSWSFSFTEPSLICGRRSHFRNYHFVRGACLLFESRNRSMGISIPSWMSVVHTILANHEVYSGCQEQNSLRKISWRRKLVFTPVSDITSESVLSQCSGFFLKLLYLCQRRWPFLKVFGSTWKFVKVFSRRWKIWQNLSLERRTAF